MISLTLLHTNDLHGRLLQVKRVATLVERIRGEVNASGGTCLYFDAGDCEDTTLLESALTKGSAMDAILHGAGCDEVALGNAIPIRYGPQAIQNLSQSFGKPILCANLIHNDGSRPAGLAPYALRDAGSLKIGVIGLTAVMDIYSIYSATSHLPEKIVPALIEEIRGEGASLVIILSHLGLRADRKLAEAVPGIGVIIGGHSHDRVCPPEIVNGVLIAQAGEHGQVLGRLDLLIDPHSGSIVEHHAELIPVGEDVPEDDQVQRAIDEEQARTQRMMQEKIGVIQVPLVASEVEECSAGNLLADALLDYFSDAEVGFVLGQHWETGLDAGTITQGGLYAANRSTGNPARVELCGEQIMTFLREALKPENIAQTRKPWRGHKAGMPHVAGMHVSVNLDNPNEMEIQVNGRKVGPEDRLIVATSDLELSKNLRYLPIPDEEIVFDVSVILPEVVERYIRRHTPIHEIANSRIEFRSFQK